MAEEGATYFGPIPVRGRTRMVASGLEEGFAEASVAVAPAADGLLLESGDALLLESSDRLLLE